MLNQVAEIAERVLALGSSNPKRVAVDGFCAAGKTTFANQLVGRLAMSNRPIIRVTTDDFQNPPDVRWQDGEHSPRGFYLHAIDFDALLTELLEPLNPSGSRRYRTSTFDIRSMKTNLSPLHLADPTSILIVDGLFLLTARLRCFWDFSIFVETPIETCIARARRRDQEQIRDADNLEARYRERYVPGFQLYLDQDLPRERADAIVVNESEWQNASRNPG